MRLMYSSNAFWAKSGYGVQGLSLLPRLAKLPQFIDEGKEDGRNNIAQFAWYGLQGGIHNVEGFTIYPQGMHPYGNDVISNHVKHFKADVLITLIDAWVLEDIINKIAPALWYPWLPIDHHDAPPKVLEAIQEAPLPLTYSKFGRDILLQHNIKNMYIPHGIEPNLYKILDDEVVNTFTKDYFHFDEDIHLSTMVAANKGNTPDRKAFQWQLRAWAEFSRDKPNARLYLHTEPTPMYNGLNLVALCQQLGIIDKVLFPDRYENFLGFSTEFMSLVYNRSNILLAASMGEGFGIPIIEAQACGTPVITNNFTAMPELIRHGTILEPSDYLLTPLDAFMCIPDVNAIKETLEVDYQNWVDNKYSKDKEASIKASKAIHDEFSWDLLVEQYWKPLFVDIENEINSTAHLHETEKTEVIKPKNKVKVVKP